MLKKWFGSWAELKHLPREIWILAFSSLVNRLGTMALPFLALYLTQERGLAPTRAGGMLALYGVVALGIGPIAGRWSDRWGPVRVMELTLFLSGLAVMLYPLATSLAALAAVTCLFAATTESFRPSNAAIISEIVPPAQRKYAFALQRLAVNIGMGIGPAMGGFIAKYSFPSIFVINGVALILATTILRFSDFHRLGERWAPRAAIDATGGWLARAIGDAARDTRFRYFLLAVVPVGMVFFQHNSTPPLFMAGNLGLSAASFGVVMTINTALIIATEIPLNAATAHWSHRRSMAIGSAFFALGFGCLVFATSVWAVAVSVAIWTVGEMILFPTMAAYVADIAPAAKRGEYMGLYTMAFSLSFTLGPLAGTQLFSSFGARSVWLASLLTGAVSALLLARVWEARPVIAPSAAPEA